MTPRIVSNVSFSGDIKNYSLNYKSNPRSDNFYLTNKEFDSFSKNFEAKIQKIVSDNEKSTAAMAKLEAKSNRHLKKQLLAAIDYLESIRESVPLSLRDTLRKLK